MDKEMLGKVNEVLKAHGRQELNIDEQEQVVGGGIAKGVGPGTIYFNGDLIGEADFNAIFISLTKNVSLDVAIQVLHAETGFWDCQMRGDHVASPDPVEEMNIILNNFWLNINRRLYE